MKTMALKALLLYAFSIMTIQADTTTVQMHSIHSTGVGDSIGLIKIRDVSEGVQFDPNLKSLAPGLHGFHVHENGSCNTGEKDGSLQAGLAAGSHYDPDKSGKHLGPKGGGHKGDLPAIHVGRDGSALTPVKSERLSLNDLHGRALIIHANPDDYDHQPGGARIACGVIP